MSEVSPEPELASPRDAASPAGDPIAVSDPPAAAPWFAPPDSGPFPPLPGAAPATAFQAPDTAGIQATAPGPVRRIRGPLIGFIAGAVAVALGLGGYFIAQNMSASRNSTPVATSSQVKSGGITVTGHGVTMSFPAGWVNVPTSPNQIRQFVKNFEAAHGHIPAALRAALQALANDPQTAASFAMVVYKPGGSGSFVENLDAAVGPPGPPPGEMLADLKSGQGPAQFGGTDVHYTVTKFGQYSGVLATYTISAQGVTVYGAQSYLDGPTNTVVTTVTSQNAATTDADLRRIVDTLRFT